MPSIREQLELYDRKIGRPKGGRSAATRDTSRQSKLGYGGKCLKLYLKGLSIFILLAGMAVVAGGAYAQNNVDVIQIVGSNFTNAVLCMGAFLIILGILGLAGAMRESKAIITLFEAVLICMFVVLLILAAIILSNVGSEKSIIGVAWVSSSDNARNSIQAHYFCCGANVPNGKEKGSICPHGSQAIPCIPLLINSLKEMYLGFGVVGILLAVICLTGICAGCVLMRSIDASEQQQQAMLQQAEASDD